jgi:hypothetical protein
MEQFTDLNRAGNDLFASKAFLCGAELQQQGNEMMLGSPMPGVV